jgi:PHP family Zn ribbon phosphoesterase
LGRKKLARKPCVNCGTTDTPQWRQGVNGVRNLCNACGVRFRKGQLDHLYKLASAGK